MTATAALRRAVDTIVPFVIARLRLTAATISRLFDLAPESVWELRLETPGLPTLIQFEAVLRVLIDGGLLVLTVPKALEHAARDLLRCVPGFGPNAARELAEPGHMRSAAGKGKATYRAPPGAEKGQPISSTVDIHVRKGRQPRRLLETRTAMKPQQRSLGIRYAGSKLKFVGKTLPFLLPQLRPGDVVVSPFAGSLKIEAELACRGFAVNASDHDEELIAMWTVIKTRRREFVRAAIRLLAEKDALGDDFGAVKALFYVWRDEKISLLTDPVERAAMSFAIRRMAAFGSRYGSFAWATRFNESSIRNVAAFPLGGITLGTADFRDAIDRASKSSPLLLDPPYMGVKSLYAGPDWKADDYCDLLDRIVDHPRWLLHMNLCGDSLALFAGFPMAEIEVRYASTGLIGKELIILPRNFAA